MLIVTDSLNPVSIAMTSPVVRTHEVGVYSIVAVGGCVSCIYTVLVALPVCTPSEYRYSIMYVPTAPVFTIPLMMLISPVALLSDHIAHDSM